ncbi:MAG: winged helix-turn-helix domain-containing protein [Candidatus Hodarchaeales archaeon]|jgi:DNA-binding transcriptional ArsR family regulator
MSELDEQSIFEILSHSTRRNILRILSHDIHVTYSEFQENIGQSPGVIYHHLEKLRDQGIVQQRSNKEYELTALGSNIVSYMDKLSNDELSEYISRNSFHKFFLAIPLAKIVQENPFHWLFEAGLVIIFTLVVQVDFSIQIIGPFLFPSLNSFELRLFLQVISYGLLTLLMMGIGNYLTPSSSRSSDFHLMKGFLVFPLLSSVFSCFLWFISVVLTTVPLLLYWSLTILLHALYTYFLIHLLMRIKRISFEHALILSLVQIYVFLVLFLLIS